MRQIKTDLIFASVLNARSAQIHFDPTKVSYVYELGQYNDIKEIFWATGACLFIRASVFQQLGGFDDEFFAHMEEIDLCWRIHRAGFQIMYCPGSTVFHVGGGTLPKDNPRKTYFNFRNNLMMIYKNADPKKLHSILLFRTIFDLVAAVHFLFTNGWKVCRAVLQAHSYFRHYKKRNPRRVAGSVTDPSVQLIYPKSILFSYFIFRKKKFTDLTHFR